MTLFEEIKDFCKAYGRMFPDHMASGRKDGNE